MCLLVRQHTKDCYATGCCGGELWAGSSRNKGLLLPQPSYLRCFFKRPHLLLYGVYVSSLST